MSAPWPSEVDAGDGVVLRAPDPVDAEEVTAAINRSLEHLRPFMAWATEATTVEQQALRLAVSAEAFAAGGGDAVYTLFLHDRVVGGMGLHRRQGPGAIEIGYWIDVEQEGRGLVTRAARALIEVVLAAGIGRVVIRCDEANARSAAVPRRLGFTLVGTEEVEPAAPANTGRMLVWELVAGTA